MNTLTHGRNPVSLFYFLFKTVRVHRSPRLPDRGQQGKSLGTEQKDHGRFRGIGANIVGALLGTVTPFCSCSSIPIFMGFTSAGLPPGVTFSFLISSPMVDLGSLVLLMSIFGAKIAIVYVVMGLVIAVIGGTLIEKITVYDEKLTVEFKSGLEIDVEA